MVKDTFHLFFREFFSFVATLLFAMILYIFMLQFVLVKFDNVIVELMSNSVLNDLESVFLNFTNLKFDSAYFSLQTTFQDLQKIDIVSLILPIMILLLGFIVLRVCFYLLEYTRIYRRTTLNDRDITLNDFAKFLGQQMLQTIVSSLFLFAIFLLCYKFVKMMVLKGFPNASIFIGLILLVIIIIFLKNLFNLSWGFSIICNKDAGIKEIFGLTNGYRKIDSKCVTDNLIITISEVVSFFVFMMLFDFSGLIFGFVICLLINVCQNVVNYYRVKNIDYIK